MGKHGGTYRGDRRTPRDFFGALSRLIGGFDMDVAATKESALCARYFTEVDSALPSSTHWSGVCWCNPPYKKSILSKFVEKAFFEARSGRADTWLICPATKTDQEWWHQYALNGYALISVKGRLGFWVPDEKQLGGDHASVLIVFKRGHLFEVASPIVCSLVPSFDDDGTVTEVRLERASPPGVICDPCLI